MGSRVGALQIPQANVGKERKSSVKDKIDKSDMPVPKEEATIARPGEKPDAPPRTEAKDHEDDATTTLTATLIVAVFLVFFFLDNDYGLRCGDLS